MRGRESLTWVPLLFCVVAGCGGKDTLYRVEGKVIYNKAPLQGVLVTFHLKGADPIKAVPPTGFTKEDGTFALSTGDKKGAAAGEYAVTFICAKDTAPRGRKGPIDLGVVETTDFLNGAFVDAKQSRFKVEVKPGTNNLEPFVLK